MPDSPRLQSGKFHERPMWPRALIRRPFASRQVPDVATKTYEQRYTCTRSRYSPAIATRSPGPVTFGGTYLGPGDAAVTSAYLALEEDLEPLTQVLATVRRVFAMIPVEQVSYDSTTFSRPLMHDISLAGGLSTVYAASFEPDTSTLLFSRFTVTALAAPATTYFNPANSQTIIAHQQVTVTLDTGTVSFYLDDSDTTITEAMSTAWIGNTASAAFFHVSRWPLGVFISWSGASVKVLSIVVTDPTIATSDRTVTLGPSSTSGPIEFLAAQTVAISTRAVTTSANHGAAVGDNVALYNGDRIVAVTQVVSVTSVTVFTIPTDAIPGTSAVLTACAFQKNGLRLANGSKDCTIKVTEKFYGPTVTTGITTGADIPPVLLYTDPIAWLGRIIATTHTGVSAALATDKLTKTAHGLSTGDTFFIIDPGSAASGLGTLTQYWAIRTGADDWKAASTPDNALAGTAVDISADSTGMKVLVPAPYAAIAVSKLKAYLGFIVSKEREEVQLADALEARSPSA